MKAITAGSFIKKLLIPILSTTCVFFSSHAFAADARLGHSFTDQHPRGQAMSLFAAEVEKATNGQIKVKVYPNSSLGSEEKMLQATQSGVEEFYMGALVPLSVRKKEMQVFDFPFLFSDTREVAAVLDGPIGKKMLDNLSDTGVIGLAWSGGAFRNISNNKRPLNKYEDLKGLKIRVMQSPVWLETFKAMGINATPMAYSEVHTALEVGALDGIEHPPVDMYQNKVYEIQKYLALSHHGYTPVGLVVSSKWFSALPADQQAAIRKAAEIARDFQRIEETRQEKVAVDQLRSEGMVITEFSPQDIDKMRAAVQPAIEKFSANIGPEFVKSFYAEIEKARALPK
jgi:tripartite ATP-independent transporter DctP family solute receptor